MLSTLLPRPLASFFGRGALLALALPLTACAAAHGPPSPPGRASRARAPAPAAAVHGHVTAHDGSALQSASARIWDAAHATVLVEAPVDPRGVFVLPTATLPGSVVMLELQGLHYAKTTLWIAPGEEVTLDVRLGTDPSRPAPHPLVVDPSGDTMIPMAAGPNGTYVGEVTLTGAPFRYRVRFASVPDVPGTSATRYELGSDDRGYVSVLEGPAGKHAIVFDPALRPPANRPPVKSFGAADARTETAALADLGTREETYLKELAQARDERVKAGTTESAAEAALTKAFCDSLLDAARSDPRPRVRSAAALSYLRRVDIAAATADDKALADRVLREVPPADALWSAFGATFSALSAVFGLADAREHRGYAEAFVATQPDVNVVATYVITRLDMEPPPEEARALLALAREPRFAKTGLASEAAAYDPDRLTAPGKPFPPFDVPSLVGGRVHTTKRISNASMKGTLYLLDVWDTHCFPCKAGIAHLDALWAAYGKGRRPGKHLEILSLSVDDVLQDVATFRADEKHAMPWTHGVVPEAKRAALFKALRGSETVAIPFYALVDEKGTILAATPHFDFAKVDALVAKTLGDAAKGPPPENAKN